MALSQIRIVHSWSAGVLEPSTRLLGRPVLSALHRYTRGLYGGISLDAHCDTTVASRGFYGLRGILARREFALLPGFSARQRGRPALPLGNSGGDVWDSRRIFGDSSDQLFSLAGNSPRSIFGINRGGSLDQAESRDQRLPGSRRA